MIATTSRPAIHFTASAALVAAAGILLVYRGQTDVGLRYDDFGLVRPWSPQDLRRVWFGSWDPTGVMALFYRPLTSWLYAARFWLFGLDTATLHGLSVAGHGLCAVLLGWFLRREHVSTWIALLGVWVYAVHPSMPYAQVSWLTNQMHLAASIVLLVALLVWQAVRDRSLVWWTPLVPLSVAIFLIKEDGIMLLPVLFGLTLCRSWLLNRVWPRRWWVLLFATAFVVAALIALRYERLGQLGGYGASPGFEQAQANFLKGLGATLLLWPTRRPWQAIASAIAIAAILVAIVAARRHSKRHFAALAGVLTAVVLGFNIPPLFDPRPDNYPLLTWQALAGRHRDRRADCRVGVAIWRVDRRALFLIAAGLTVAVFFNVPFLFVTKREQDHLVTCGAVLVLAGAGQALSAVGTTLSPRIALRAMIVAGTIPLAFLARTVAADFLPCARPELDREARGWWVVPDELRSWIDVKEERCNAGLPIPSLLEPPSGHVGRLWRGGRSTRPTIPVEQ